MNILIKGAIANCSNFTNQDLLKHLHEQMPKAEYYNFKPERKDDTITFAWVDWSIIITSIPSLLHITSLLWDIYKKFIKPNKENNTSIAGINISVNGNVIIIDSSINSKKELREIIKLLLWQNQLTNADNEIKEIKSSTNWKQIK